MFETDAPPGEPIADDAPALLADTGPAPEKMMIVRRENGSGEREIPESKYTEFMMRDGHINYIIVETQVVAAHHSQNA